MAADLSVSGSLLSSGLNDISFLKQSMSCQIEVDGNK